MLPLPDLNDQSFENIFDSAIKQIEKHSEVWTDYDVHDPGITFVELLVSLKLKQQESINTIGSRSLSKFLKLLDITPKGDQPALTWVCFNTKKQINLPKGTKLKAEDLIFETAKSIKLINNTITHLAQNKEGVVAFKEYDYKDTTRTIELFNQKDNTQREFYIAFEKVLPSNQHINLYIDVFEDYSIKRNPIVDEHSFVKLSEIIWEYYGEDNGVEGWYQLDMHKDETYDFLYSGSICFSITGIHKQNSKLENRKLIRARVTKYEYEVTPKLIGIKLNCVKLIQQDTKCQSISFTYSQYKENNMLIDIYLAYYGCYQLYIRCDNSWVLAEDIGVAYTLKITENMDFKLGTSNREQLEKMFEGLELSEHVFKLVLYSKEFYSNRIVGSSTEMAEQSFFVKADNKNILYDSFELIVASQTDLKNRRWEVWKSAENLDASKPYSKEYLLNAKRAAVKFGNNVFGKVPPKGEQNIVITSCKTTKAVDGNVKSGVINSFSEDIFEDIEIIHFKSAINGCDKQTNSELIKEAMKAKENNCRAITLQDYENIAKTTQGLMLENATAIPLYKPGLENYPQNTSENTVTVVIEAYNRGNIDYTLNSYIKNVEINLNKSKLLTTQIYVVEPKYIGLDIYSEVVVKPNSKNIESLIKDALKVYINTIQTNKLGATLYYGDICGVIESLEPVIYMKYLKLEMSNVKRNNLGDIQIPPYARVYFRSGSIIATNQ